MKTTIAALLLIFHMFFCLNSFAQTFVGTVVATKGDVKVLSLATAGDPGPFARYEGKDYSYSPAKIGKKVKPGEVVQSGPDGKAKIVYPNGDHFVIGNGTSLELPAITNSDKKETSVKLLFGRVRALVSKDGPRNNMKVKTPTAVAGVRGTDFFARSNHKVGTQLTVLRGEVTVASVQMPEQFTVVKTGFMTETKPKDKTQPKLNEVTREELTAIQEETAAVKATDAEVSQLSTEAQKELADLNQKTKEAVVKDIKTDDQKLYTELNANKDLSTEEINQMVIDKLYQMAPAGKKKKPTSEQVDSLGKDVYDKYYKNPDKKKSN